MSYKEIMNLRECAEYLGVSYSTIREWVKKRGLPAKYPGNQPRFLREEVNKWIEMQDRKTE